MWGLFRRKLGTSFLALGISISIPFVAHAESIIFTDIMYDPPGSDTGAEWVKVQNISDSPIDFSGWRFTEGGTNHKLTPLGPSLVPPRSFAIIAVDAVTYSAEHAGTADIIFDSTFSLSNTGETLMLKNASSTVMAQTTYKAEPKAPSPASPKASQDKRPAVKTASKKPVPQFATSSVAAPLVALPAQPSKSTPWLWIIGLGVLVVGAIGALFLVPKTSGSGYEIIDTSDK